MQINRQNYEQYFLLYADGELTTSQRNAVQQFVTENKDLAIELQIIQATILPKEEVKLFDKKFLLKGIDEKIQENLLLKLDNELPAKELASINALIQKDSTINAEYNILASTVLNKNEKVIFEDKHLLYKKEKDNVIPFGYLRWAAAAIFIGVAFFAGVKFYNGKTTIETVTANATKGNPIKNKITTNTEINNTSNNTVAQSSETNVETKQNNTNNIFTKTTENKLANETKKNVNNKNIVTNNIKERITNNNNEKVIKDNPNNFIAKEDFILIPSNNITTKENETVIAKNINTEKTINTERLYELENTYAYQNVVQKEEEITENKILYMNESTVKKSKVGMFFKRIKTAVQKSAKVKPGNSLQVAGFEISGN